MRMEYALPKLNPTKVNCNHYVINLKNGTEVHVRLNATYPETGSRWPWKIDDQYFDRSEWAAKYLMRHLAEKATGLRIIRRAPKRVPDICGVEGTRCRHPGECNTMLCSNCPVAEQFFADRDGLILVYDIDGNEDEALVV